MGKHKKRSGHVSDQQQDFSSSSRQDGPCHDGPRQDAHVPRSRTRPPRRFGPSREDYRYAPCPDNRRRDAGFHERPPCREPYREPHREPHREPYRDPYPPLYREPYLEPYPEPYRGFREEPRRPDDQDYHRDTSTYGSQSRQPSGQDHYYQDGRSLPDGHPYEEHRLPEPKPRTVGPGDVEEIEITATVESGEYTDITVKNRSQGDGPVTDISTKVSAFENARFVVTKHDHVLQAVKNQVIANSTTGNGELGYWVFDVLGSEAAAESRRGSANRQVIDLTQELLAGTQNNPQHEDKTRSRPQPKASVPPPDPMDTMTEGGEVPSSGASRMNQSLEELIPSSQDTGNSVCCHCGSQGHINRECYMPGDDGYIHGCPLCNTLDHAVDRCAAWNRLALDAKFDLLIRERGGSPLYQTAHKGLWYEILLGFEDSLGKKKFPAMDFPMSPSYAISMANNDKFKKAWSDWTTSSNTTVVQLAVVELTWIDPATMTLDTLKDSAARGLLTDVNVEVNKPFRTRKNKFRGANLPKQRSRIADAHARLIFRGPNKEESIALLKELGI